MAAVHVGDQLVEEVALIRKTIRATIPEVVMGITDGQLRLQRRFLREGQPVIASVRQKDTSVVGWRDARRASCLRSLVAIHHSRGAVFLCGARQRLAYGVSPPPSHAP